MTHHTIPAWEKETQEQVAFICELTGFGSTLHPNDIKHCFKKVIEAHTAQLVERVESNKYQGTLKLKEGGYTEHYFEGYNKAIDDILQAIKEVTNE